MSLQIRELCQIDYKKNYLEILKTLSDINPEKITQEDFSNFISGLPFNHKIYVVEKNNEIIGSGTLIIEDKLIHDISKVGHIEDIVIDKNCRGQNIGKTLMTYLIETAKSMGCYKVTLYCNEMNTEFYSKCGLVKKEMQMVKYL
uniref:glucosamine-phosphate N-acetyltransferase n=1 Tax=viral metagenome TaxID=1070528 RepID=A0A6C0ACU9_9ZZZZ